jgi:hypothetical protein
VLSGNARARSRVFDTDGGGSGRPQRICWVGAACLHVSVRRVLKANVAARRVLA